MSGPIEAAMQAKRESGMAQIRAYLWEGKTESAIDLAIQAGINDTELGRIQSEVEATKSTVEKGNGLDIPALEKAVAKAETTEKAEEAKFLAAEAEFTAVSRKAGECRAALMEAKNCVFFAAGAFESGKVPTSIAPSKSVLAAMKLSATQAQEHAKRAELEAKRRGICERISELDAGITESKGMLFKTAEDKKHLEAILGNKAALEAERDKVIAEINKLS